jgi:hypothetical protein
MASKPNLVRNAPGLLHAVALVAPSREGTLRNIRRMARGTPPALYRPAIEIVLSVLRGVGHLWTPEGGYEWAKKQVNTIPDDDKRRCAGEVVRALKPYLTTTAPQWIRPLSIEYYQAGPDLQIPVKLSGLMAIDGRFVVLVLHLWRKPLSIEQRQAAVAILQNRLRQRPELVDAELHFLDISIPQGHVDRQYRLATWDTLTAMPDTQLKAFTDRFYGAWSDYQADPEPKPQRKPRPSPYSDIFGDDPTEPR